MAQSVNIISLPEERLLLSPASSPEFKDFFSAPDAFSDALKYAVVLKNNSDQEVIAYHVRWTWTDGFGKVTRGGAVVYNFSDLRPGKMLVPGGKHFVSEGAWMGAGPRPSFDAAASQQVQSQLHTVESRRSVTISLEAVVFADGTAAGRDTDNWVPKWKAWVDAERDVLAFTGATSSGDPRQALASWQELAFSRAKRQVSRDVQLPDLYVLAGNSSSYEEAYVLFRGSFASDVIQRTEQYGVESEKEMARSSLRAKQYPTIHRKAN